MDLPDLNMINQKVPIFSRKRKLKEKGPITFFAFILQRQEDL